MSTNHLGEKQIFISWGKKYDYEIVGESNYQENLGKIAGRKEEKAKKLSCIARLQKDFGNIHDESAVSVKINDLIVGYLSKGDNKKFLKQIKLLKFPDDVVVTAKAQVVGGWKNQFSEGKFGVNLSLPRDYSRFKYCISEISMDDADLNLDRNPLSDDQLEFFIFLGLDIPEKLNYFNFTRYKNSVLKKLKQDGSELYDKWIDHINNPPITMQDIYDFWGDKDERESFWIKKPKKTELTLVINNLLERNVTLENMFDNPELVHEELIKINPSLERD